MKLCEVVNRNKRIRFICCLLIAFVFAFSGVIFPAVITVHASPPFLGGLATSLQLGMAYISVLALGPLILRLADYLNEKFTAIKEFNNFNTYLLDGKLTGNPDNGFYVSESYNFTSDEDRKMTEIICQIMNDLRAEGFLSASYPTVGDVGTSHKYKIEEEVIRRIEEIGQEAVLKILYPDYYIEISEVTGDRIVYIYGVMKIGDYNFPVRDLSDYSQFELQTKTQTSSNNEFNFYGLLPYYVNSNGDVCILSRQYLSSSSYNFIGHDGWLPVFGLYFYPLDFPFSIGSQHSLSGFFRSDQAINTSWGFNINVLPFVFEPVLDNNYLFRFRPYSNYGGYYISIPNKFLNTRTLQHETKTDMQGVGFIECPASCYDNLGIIFSDEIARCLNSQIPLDKTYDRDKAYEVPLPPITDILTKGKEAGVIVNDPDIVIDTSTGDVLIGERSIPDIDDLVDEIEEIEDELTDTKLDVQLKLQDKFPFSLPRDIYNFFTIFVYPEKKPIFEVPIKFNFAVNYSRGGKQYLNIPVEADEVIVLDFTRFKFPNTNVDIVRLLIRTFFNLMFIYFLIHVTPKLKI